MEMYKGSDIEENDYVYSVWVIKCLGSYKDLNEIGTRLLDMAREGIPSVKPIKFKFNEEIINVRNYKELWYFARGLLAAANTFGVKLVSDKIIKETNE